MISVVIASRNRQKKLLKCVGSILKNRHLNFEVIIVDQTKSPLKNSIQNSCVRYFHKPGKGKSKALNIGISKARGNILAFTDDDCIVSEAWLNSIDKFFKQHRDVDAVFGQTFPYEPNINKGLICPCTNKFKKLEFFKKPTFHMNIGFGNNMAIKKQAFVQFGNFKEWLGPGSIGSNAEDAEFILRLLTNKKTVGRNPLMIVFHDNWLNQEKMANLYKSYVCGEIACYGYYSIKGYAFAREVIKKRLTSRPIFKKDF